jgi:two-component system cell cycle response regulator DivK
MGMNILYIEDNPDNMILVKRVLEAAGHTIFQAATGIEGITVAEQETVDLIPIIAITANALKGDAENALAAGCDVYMSKPINIHELRARVEGFAPASEMDTTRKII